MAASVSRRSAVASLTTSALGLRSVFSIHADGTGESQGLLSSATGPLVGSVDAIVTMHIYNDFQSTFGRAFYFDIVPLIVEDFVQEGDVALVFHDFPRLGTDPKIADPDNVLIELADPRNESSLAAQAAMSAGEQGKYLHMCDRMFASFKDVQSGTFLRESLNRMAMAIQLDMDQFHESMNSGKYLNSLANSILRGRDIGITATPMFVLDSENGNPDVVMNTAEGYALLKRQIEVAVLMAK